MSEQNKDAERASFAREDRYIVLKRKHLANLPNQLQHRLKPALDEAAQLMPTMECVVVESDWPEYERVWQMIEARATGASLPVGVPAITPAMIEAGANQVVAPIATAGKKAEAVFRAMLAAAPTVKAEQPSESAIKRAAKEMNRLGYGYHESHAESILISANKEGEV